MSIELIIGIIFLLVVASTYPTWQETYEQSKQDKSRKRKNDE